MAHATTGQSPAPPAPQQGLSTPAPCWYAVLGVTPGASAEEIKRAYRQAALRKHPDKAAAASGGSSTGHGAPAAAAGGDEFWLVQQAWEVRRCHPKPGGCVCMGKAPVWRAACRPWRQSRLE